MGGFLCLSQHELTVSEHLHSSSWHEPPSQQHQTHGRSWCTQCVAVRLVLWLSHHVWVERLEYWHWVAEHCTLISVSQWHHQPELWLCVKDIRILIVILTKDLVNIQASGMMSLVTTAETELLRTINHLYCDNVVIMSCDKQACIHDCTHSVCLHILSAL